MTYPDFSIRISVDQSPAEVFDAINNVAAWWQGEISGNSHQLNDEFEYLVMGVHFSKQQVVEIIPGEKVTWLVTDSNLNSFGDKKEWNGTKIIFEISTVDNKTQLCFTHLGLVPRFECYGDCSYAWSQLIQVSLFSLITTGKGKDVF